jgi:long-chain fatty acid transport protein
MKRIVGVVAVTYLAVASPAYATNGMRMIGFGPVQNSMGGVSIAVPLDASTVATNPAGLLSIGKRIDVGGTYFAPKVEYKATQLSGAPMPPGSVVMQDGKAIESDRGASYIPTLAASWSLNDDLAAGVGVFGTAGMGVDDPRNLYGGITETSYMQARLAPGLAYRVMPGLVAGITFNAMYAMMNFDVAGGSGMKPREDGTAFGYGATLGVLYTPIEMVTLGAAYETKSSFQSFEFDVPAHTVLVPDGLGGFTTRDVPGGTEKLDFDQPPVASLGVAVRPIEGLVLAVDGQYIFWSETNGLDQPKYTTGREVTAYQPFNLRWDDQVVLKVGGEYAVVKDVKVRLGYNYGKNPLRADRGFENIAFPAVAEHHITGGVGLTFGQTVINAAVGYSPEAKISGSAPEQAIASYEASMSQLSFDLGVAYRF